jgi:protein-disulfide isomerase
MIPFQVNRARSLVILALAIACAPANSSKQGAESGVVGRSDTAKIAAPAAPADPDIAKADLARIQGSPNAPLWVIEVSDFQCPYCKEWHDQTYKTFLDELVSTGKVRLAYVNFPLSSHQFAWPAAESAMCAAAQGKFWEMHDALFNTQQQWEVLPSPALFFDSLARAQKVDIDRWHQCVQSGKMKPLIQADHDRAETAGASATPSFMIGDKLLAGAQPIEVIRQVVDSAMAKRK